LYQHFGIVSKDTTTRKLQKF